MPMQSPKRDLHSADPARLAIYDALAASPDQDMKSLSLACGHNHAYFHQYLFVGTPKYINERDRPVVAKVLGIPEDILRPPLKTAKEMAKELMGAQHVYEIQASAIRRVPARNLLGTKDLRVYGTTEGGEGVLILSSEPVDMIKRPAPLLYVQEGYGVIVTGESMIPVFRPGDIALVHPHIPPRQDTEVVLQRDEHGSRYGILKTFLRVSGPSYRLRQYNPPLDFTRPRSEWPICHSVVGRYDRR